MLESLGRTSRLARGTGHVDVGGLDVCGADDDCRRAQLMPGYFRVLPKLYYLARILTLHPNP